VVDVELEGVQTVVAALRTDDLARRPGERGSTPRPKTVTLARAKRPGAPALQLRLRPGARHVARLARHRSLSARVTVLARRQDGSTLVVTQTVRLIGG
jgi:hypothetical protein